MSKRNHYIGGIPGLLIALLYSPIAAGETRPSDPVNNAAIYYSAAPWDGSAYEIRIPFEKTQDAVNPCIRVHIWGNPEFAKPRTIYFSGKEDAGGGPGKGDGRASFQTVLDHSWPEEMKGSISFRSLKRDRPVAATYELTTLKKGRKFKGSFRAAWGNKPSGGRGGGVDREAARRMTPENK
jgi:hypothetical protein